jgi:hypothetical protein
VRTAFTASKAVLDCDIATILVPEETIGKVGGVNPREEDVEEGRVDTESGEEVDTALAVIAIEEEDDVVDIRSLVLIRLSDRNHLFD